MNAEHILIVEDDKLVSSLVRSKLQAGGYQVTQAKNIPQALEMTDRGIPDLLILDLTVLDEDPFAGLTDGFAFLRLLRGKCPDLNLPVIIYSADNSESAQAKAKELEVAALVPKSARMNELLATVRKVLDARQAPQCEASGPQ